jgi:hypothetical protein
MNNLPRQMLRRILNKYGSAVCGDAKRCENLLLDLCGSHRREINVLVNAIEERVPLDLLAGSRSMPLELLLNRLEKRLEEQTAMTAEAASWAVESWALALNLATDAEIEVREKRAKSSPPISNAARTIQPPDSADGGTISNVNRNNPVQPPAPTPAPQSRVNPPPVIRQPTTKPSPLPPVFSPTSNQPAAAPPIQAQTVNPPSVSVKRFGFFRGCLLVIFLLAVTSVALFFGVPYAIDVMRETQRERSNESPRFPVR